MSIHSLPDWNRAVVKVGSALVAPDDRGCRTTHLLPIARFIVDSRRAGKEVLLVSSGAVAAGRAAQGDRTPASGRSIPERQALAAVGQPLLMEHWRRLFDEPCAQILLTYDDLRRRSRFVNAKNTIAELLNRGVLPIVNENDTVAVEELQVGDNDNLAAYVAVLAEADLLVICSDVDGFYSADPHENPEAERIEVIDAITDEIRAMAGGSHHASATGGMRTKLEAAEKATDRGIDTVLIDGTDGDHLDALGRGEMPGTLFRRADAGRRLSGRKHWMLHALPAEGLVTIDDGAARALRERGASLLPAGIVNVEGAFARGDAVRIQTEDASRVAKGITQYSADELRRIRGRQSHDLSTLLDRPDAATTDYVVHRDDLALTREARR